MIFDPWSPFFDVQKTLNEMDRIFNVVGQPLGLRSVPRGTFPAINVYDRGNAAVLTAEMNEGVLTVHIGKTEKAEPRRIAITAGRE
jgi:HSP20 family molecular chaperone IbpA